MQGAVHSLPLKMPVRSPLASSDRLCTLSDDVMQDAQPYIPATASVNIKQTLAPLRIQKSLSCLVPMTESFAVPEAERCNSADATMDTLAQEYILVEEGPEIVEESQGAAGDAYRFRYSRVSPEEGYSPIAGVTPFRRDGTAARAQHVWISHEDEDGAICSKPIHGPLSIIVRAADGSDQTFQVVDGMCVGNLKEKIWNMTGLPPSSQCLVLPNGAAAEDSMQFAGSGMQQYDVLYLKTS